MEKIIVAIRTLNDNLKIVATRVEDLEKRIDTIEARIDGIGSSLNDSIHKLADDTQARLAELTERVYALEHIAPTAADVSDDVGDALDDILGMAMEEASTVVEEKPTAEVVEEKPTVEVVEETMPTDDAETALDALLGSLDTPVPKAEAPKKTPTKTKAVVASAVQRRAFARQYMVERGAKVEDLRSPAKIEEVMQTEEFQKWVVSR